MAYKCVWNIGRENCLTNGKIYQGYGYDVSGSTFIRIVVCDDGDYGIFSRDRFEIVEG